MKHHCTISVNQYDISSEENVTVPLLFKLVLLTVAYIQCSRVVNRTTTTTTTTTNKYKSRGVSKLAAEGNVCTQGREEVTEVWRKLHTDEIYKLYSSPYTISTIKSMWMRRVHSVACISGLFSQQGLCSMALVLTIHVIFQDNKPRLNAWGEVTRRRVVQGK